jgi:STE24 endopeptidase
VNSKVISLTPFLICFLGLFLFQFIFSTLLERINQQHLGRQSQGGPGIFAEFIDRSKLSRMIAYSRENSRLSILEQAFSDVIVLIILLSGFLPFLDGLTREWGFSFILAGLIFWITPGIISSLLELPLDYYHTFVIEEKYGFNKATRKTWITDQLKTAVLSLVLFSLLFTAILGLMRLSPNRWWVWGFLIVSLFQWLMAVIYPVVIAPLFNKFEPLQDPDLSDQVAALMQAAGIRIKGIFQMDAGRRSGHTNAYFTGLGKSKRIVLFDTLIQSHPREEILAVLAHEAGHYKAGHIWKQLFVFECALAAALYLSFLLIDQPGLYQSFGFRDFSPYAGLFLISLFGQKLAFFLSPFYMALSRKYEYQADRYAAGLLKSPSAMISVLKRLAADNLSNLFPHPWYVRFHYSHPPLKERIAAIEKSAGREPA